MVESIIRIRRVKCDESKPHYWKCTSTGCWCEGPIAQEYRFVYDRSFKQHGPPTISLPQHMLTQNGDKQERRAFNFLHEAVPVLFGGPRLGLLVLSRFLAEPFRAYHLECSASNRFVARALPRLSLSDRACWCNLSLTHTMTKHWDGITELLPILKSTYNIIHMTHLSLC